MVLDELNLKPRLRGWAAFLQAEMGRGTGRRGFYAKHLRFGDIAFDIGANIGTHTEAMLRRGARVVAIEPQPDLAESLRAHHPTATVLPTAVGEAPGRARLHTSSAHSDHATLSESWVEVGGVSWDGSRGVEVTTLDALIAQHGIPRLMKLDIEGYEDKALAGLTHPLEHVLFEIHGSMIDVAERALARLDSLGRYEYRVMVEGSWIFGPPVTPAEILRDPPSWADIHARLI